MADSNKKAEKIAAAKKKLKQFQKSGRTRSVSRNRESAEREIVPRDQESVERHVRTASPEVLSQAVNGRSPEPQLMDGSNNGMQTTASTESLQQLSRQINGLLSEADSCKGTETESSAFLNGEEGGPASNEMQELEERNRDLASLLEQHSQANQQLNLQNQQLREHSKSLQDQLELERNSFHEKQKKDIGSLKEQLQVHIQTIGILVAEKTELQSQVNQSQRIADQRIEEIEEFSGRLKASRQRVADLERTLSTSSQSSQQLEKAAAENAKELDRLKLDLYKSNKQNEELHQQTSELVEQLQSKAQETTSSGAVIEELQKKLEMAELYAQQLSSQSESSAGSVEVLNALQKERDSLLARLHQHEELTSKLQMERDQVTEQYQSYTEQLRHQTTELTQQVTILTEEREQLLYRQHQLEQTVNSLNNRLEDAMSNPPLPPTPPAVPSIPSEVTEELNRLRSTDKEAREALDVQVRDNMQLSRLLEEREERILSLERSVEEMDQQAGDKAQLLESVQSDKTALSRAMSQNKELKLQLAELQQGFVKMSNDNMELVTRLHAEQHASKEQSSKLGNQEDELMRLKEMLSKKEGEVNQLQVVTSTQMSEKEQYQQDQVTDRLRHYEAQAQLVDTLQSELTSAQDMMDALTTQNRELRSMLIKATEVKQPSKDDTDSDVDMGESQRNDIVRSLHATIRQLEEERTQLYENLKEQRQLSDSLGIKIADLQEDVIRKTTDSLDSDKISRGEYNELKTAMEMITQKYTHVMKDKAELTDKADQLEHLVLQLQGETDTIGEYISLYHHQRALLLQRETQKNDYIAQLARDREQLQDKLGELQILVMQLLGEKNMLHSYNRETQLSPEAQDQKQMVSQSQHPLHNAAYQNGISNGTSGQYDLDWPDYTSSESDAESEVEPIVGGQQNLSTPELGRTPTSSPPDSPEVIDPAHRPSLYTGNPMDTDGQEASYHQHHHHQQQQQHPHHHGRLHHQHEHHHHPDGGSHASDEGSSTLKEGKTAHKILTLLTELGHSHLVEQVPLIDRNFLPCKFCKGAVQIV